MATQLNVVFMGTPEFAAVSLRYLVRRPKTNIIAVFTQPDRPQGRGRKMMPSPVKMVAQEVGLTVCQPTTLSSTDVGHQLRAFNPDFLLVAAYGLMLPRKILDIPRYNALNVHASLLPKYRGAAPIQRALANGESVTGISIMAMEPGLDCGPVLLQHVLPIAPDDTASSLHDKLAELGGKCLVNALDRLENHDYLFVPQEKDLASYAPKLHKEEGRIEWNLPAARVHDHIRAMHPWPGAFTYLNRPSVSAPLKITVFPGYVGPELEKDIAPGTITAGPEDTLYIACADRYYQIFQLKPSSRKPMSTAGFCCGYLPARSENGWGRFG
jgi:methionyl-tRNA formyltransferase